MARRNMMFVGIVALAGLMTAAIFRWNDQARPTVTAAPAAKRVPNSESASSGAPTSDRITEESRNTINADDAEHRRDNRSHSPEHAGIALPRANLRDGRVDPESPVTSLHPDDDQHPLAVVGRLFAVSASVEMGREKAPHPEKDALMSAFAQEPRDVAWAGKVEAHLQQALSGIDNTTVRSIECRTSMCLFEVAYVGRLTYNIYSDDFLESQLRYEGTIYGYETDATSQRITVAVEINRRRN